LKEVAMTSCWGLAGNAVQVLMAMRAAVAKMWPSRKTKPVLGSWLFNPKKAALAETTCGNQNYLWH